MSRPAALFAVVVLAALAACGDGAGGSSPAAVRDSAGSRVEETTTTTAAGERAAASSAAGAAGAAGGTTTTTTRRATTTTAARRATTTTAPAGSRPLTPAAPGTYRFDTAGSTVVAGSTVPFPAVTTLVVDPPSGIRQRSTRNLRDASGNGSALEFTLDYRPAGVYLVNLRITTGFSGVTDIRSLVPATPVLLLATGARPGAHVESDIRVGEATARLVVDVLREERLSIGGQAVDTLVMRAVVTLPPGDVTGRQELTMNVDRGSRLWVRERSVADASAAGGLITLHSEYTATLQRLTP